MTQHLWNDINWSETEENIIATIQEKLNNGAKINDVDEKGNTLAHHAAFYHYETVLNFLSQHNIDVNIQNHNGITPIVAAIMAPNKDGEHTSKMSCVQSLIFQGADLEGRATRHQNTPLLWSIQSGDAGLVNLFIKNGADRTAENFFGLNAEHFARQLPNTAAKNSILHSLQFAKAHAEDNTQLIYAARFGDHNSIESAFPGAYINAKDENGETAAMWAAKKNRVDTLKFLESHKANFYIKDHQGRTLAHHAAIGGAADSIKFAIQHKIGHTLDRKGRTPLMYASQYNHPECIELLANPQTINARDYDEKSALDHAVEAGNIEAVVKLIELGANALHRNAHGKNAFDYLPSDNEMRKASKSLETLQQLKRHYKLIEETLKNATKIRTAHFDNTFFKSCFSDQNTH